MRRRRDVYISNVITCKKKTKEKKEKEKKKHLSSFSGEEKKAREQLEIN